MRIKFNARQSVYHGTLQNNAMDVEAKGSTVSPEAKFNVQA